MAEMVWCNSCNTVVWAYDHQPHMDIRGLVNMFGLPCPNCHRTHCFDGWGTNSVEELAKRYPNEVFDGWWAMKLIAKMHYLEWKPSPDNRWLIGAYEGLRLSIKRWQEEQEQILATTIPTDEVALARLDGKIEAFKYLLGEC